MTDFSKPLKPELSPKAGHSPKPEFSPKAELAPKTETISSPCVRNCCLDERDICAGCGRSLEQIVNWRSYSEEHRLEIITLIQSSHK